jgi:hypothetical protein
MTVWIDNLVIYIGSGAKLWKVTAFPTAPVWTNISPATNEAPIRPHDFAVDKVNTAILNTVSEVGNDWYKSTNSGSSWSTFLNNTAYKCVYTVGNAILAGGDEVIGISLNNGSSFSDLSGNLDSVWDGISIIKKVLAL